MFGGRVAWTVVVNLFYVGVVVAVFSAMPDGGTKQIVAVLALIYCVLRQQFMAAELSASERFLILYGLMTKVDPDNALYYADELKEARTAKTNSTILLGIHSVALVIIALIGLATFFEASGAT